MNYSEGMILRFSLENYRSYRDQATLSMERRSFRTNRPKDEDWTSVTVRRAALYGANASGKSNIIRPLGLLSIAVEKSIERPGVLRKLRDPHKLAAAESTRFEVDYVSDNVRYEWFLELADTGVVEETLRANPSGHWRIVFSRRGGEVEFGAKSGVPKAAQENIRQFARDWALTLSAFTVVRTAGPFTGAATWWLDQISMMYPQGEEAGHPVDRHQSVAWAAASRAVLRSADVGITEVDVNEREAPEQFQQVFNAVKEIVDSTSRAADGIGRDPDPAEIPLVIRYLEFTHTADGPEFTLEGPEESLGTRQWLDLATSAIDALVTGGVLLVDEIDSSLHPVLLRHLVELFADEELNEAGAQMIFTTHDSSLLSNLPGQALAREEVWLVNKNAAVSDLVCLDEYSVRDAHNIEKRYLSGAFEAIPVPRTVDIRHAVKALRSIRADDRSGE